MEVYLYNSTVCRLCGEENDNGTFLYSADENNQNASELVNAYLPIKVSDDGQLPRTICPGCTIQLEATIEFINLIINGQKVIRSLYQREKEYKKRILQNDEEVEVLALDKVIPEVNCENGVYKPENSASLQVAGLKQPKRKRGRPPKKHKTPEELAQEAAAKEQELMLQKYVRKEEEPTGKRKRKTPTRFKEVVQGKELEKILVEEGVTDGEVSDNEMKSETNSAPKEEPPPKLPEIIGHTDKGDLVVVVTGKGRGRPKGRLRQKCQKCYICGKEFFCSGRYMSHVAQHGPVSFQCQQCSGTYPTWLDFNKHQEEAKHKGQIIIPYKNNTSQQPKEEVVDDVPKSLPDLDPLAIEPEPEPTAAVTITEPTETEATDASDNTAQLDKDENTSDAGPKRESVTIVKGKIKLHCPHCEKMFSSKQSRSMHIKAVHKGERPYSCGECGAVFAYPRALALHAVSHRATHQRGFACDLCGKVLNHPSSVTYHKEAEHAGLKFVCNKCGKCFKHKQLLQRHQLVHTHHRPFHCKTCDATFKTKSNLINHQLLHSGVKKYSCDLCRQKFAHKTSLTLHMRWHNGQKPYVCKVCGKAFSQKGNLSEHSRIHTGEKPFQCVHCPRRFTTSSQFRLHMRRHQTSLAKENECVSAPKLISISPGAAGAAGAAVGAVGAGGHRCGWCARECPSRWSLLKHARRHTGERPFRCPHCPRAFADCSNLNKHKKYVHKQVSLLANSIPPQEEVATSARETECSVVETTDAEERVIFVTYDADDETPQYHLVEADETEEDMQSKITSACQLYSEPMVVEPKLQHLDPVEHMPVTDEQGNPLHFTMQDGTQLAITSIDGQTLQVITEDGETIPVEINGFTTEETQDIMETETVVHQLDEKSEEGVLSPVTHYYTIV